uniref:Ion transport domain-containing protein n=1 Tax=Biomphalaria glabrata TaxID=6526 RepID=A0A2C9KPX7_BIOGL
MNPLLIFHILKRPFWSLFGDFSINDIDTDVKECTTDSAIYDSYTELRCPSKSGTYLVPALMGIYVIIVDILLFNLLIALFNADIIQIEKKASQIWHHQTLSFTFEHIKMICLPPPFTVLMPVLLYLQKKDDPNSPFVKEEKDRDKMIKLANIEKQQRDICIEEMENKE